MLFTIKKSLNHPHTKEGPYVSTEEDSKLYNPKVTMYFVIMLGMAMIRPEKSTRIHRPRGLFSLILP